VGAPKNMPIIIVKKTKSRYNPNVESLLFIQKKIKNYNGANWFLFIAKTKISNFFKKNFKTID
jgi:hypothetical protein